MYDLLTATFYWLFLITGMGYCGNGWVPTGSCRIWNGHRQRIILLVLVDWVEKGVAPAIMNGSGVNGTVRTLCRYPKRSVFEEGIFLCIGLGLPADDGTEVSGTLCARSGDNLNLCGQL
jgi:hypothetical protein